MKQWKHNEKHRGEGDKLLFNEDDVILKVNDTDGCSKEMLKTIASSKELVFTIERQVILPWTKVAIEKVQNSFSNSPTVSGGATVSEHPGQPLISEDLKHSLQGLVLEVKSTLNKPLLQEQQQQQQQILGGTFTIQEALNMHTSARINFPLRTTHRSHDRHVMHQPGGS